MDAKEEVRSRLAIEDVIGEYIPLKRAGRSWKGLSPFSGEKTPSFFVSPEKQIWHDFSSNKGGDVFAFVMEVEGLDFRGALEMLARKAGVDLTQFQNAGNKGLAQKKQRIIEMHRLAVAYYQQCLVRSREAVDYISRRRGMNRAVVASFEVGYAPSVGNALVGALRKKGYRDSEIKDAGLATTRRGGLGDIFRDRIVVPLADTQGQVIGFTGRILADIPNAPKYLNTPQTLVYDKSRHVFGFHFAKEAIRQKDYAVVVEGNLDVLSSHQAGIAQVVATAGTAMTEYHLKTLSRMTHNIRLAFDNDKAGVAATERAIPIAQKVGVELSIVVLPDAYKDPDELIKHDPSLWVAAIESPVPVVEWLIGYYKRQFDLTTAAGKRQVTSAVMKIIKTVEDAVEQEHYVRILSEATGASETALYDKLSDTERAASVALKPMKVSSQPAASQEAHAYQDYLLGLALYDHDIRPEVAKLSVDELEGSDRQAILAYLQTTKDRIKADELPAHLREISTYVNILLFKAETRYQAINSTERMVEAVRLVRQVKNEKRKTTKDQLIASLRDAEQRHDNIAAGRLRAQLNELIKEK